MKVRALRSFVGNDAQGQRFRADAGSEFELPEGVDWLQAGLVVPVGGDVETAAVAAPETAVKPKAKARKKRTSVTKRSRPRKKAS